MTQNELDQIAEKVAQRLSGSLPQGGSGVAYPKELADPNVDPALRAAVLEAYTGRLMDLPASTLNQTERKAMLEQAQIVLKGMGY